MSIDLEYQKQVKGYIEEVKSNLTLLELEIEYLDKDISQRKKHLDIIIENYKTQKDFLNIYIEQHKELLGL